jgi:hypothetical protein
MCFQYHVNQHSILYDNLKNKNITTLFKQIQKGLTFYSNGESTLMIVSFHEVCAHKTSLTLPHFSEVSVPSQKHMSGHAKGIAFQPSHIIGRTVFA